MNIDFIKSSVAKKGIGIAMAVVMGIVTIVNTLADQKREQEFESMKEALSKLQNK